MIRFCEVYNAGLPEELRLAVLLYHVVDLLGELRIDALAKNTRRGAPRLNTSQRMRAESINEAVLSLWPRTMDTIAAAELRSAAAEGPREGEARERDKDAETGELYRMIAHAARLPWKVN